MLKRSVLDIPEDTSILLDNPMEPVLYEYDPDQPPVLYEYDPDQPPMLYEYDPSSVISGRPCPSSTHFAAPLQQYCAAYAIILPTG